MAFKYDITETIDPAALRSGNNQTGTDIGPYLLVTGTYEDMTLPAAANDPILGVTRDTAKGTGSNTRGRLAIRGTLPVMAGSGGFSAGDRLMPEANTGKAIPWAPSTAANATIIGVAQEDAAANATGMVELNIGATGQG